MTRSLTAYILFALALAHPAGAAAGNSLKDHPSPYLEMHSKDPVQWREWNERALSEARAGRRLLFVSSGYFACHWCHVMQRESFRNPVIAEVLNRFFIPVKVDRELSPALDARLIDFVERTQGHAGWPLNVFVTPDGHPLLGFVYLPPDNLLGVLKQISKRWRDQAEELEQLSRDVVLTLEQAQGSAAAPLTRETVAALPGELVALALQAGDEMSGGFGSGNKFPMAPQLDTLLELSARPEQQRLREFLRLTLDQMASQGLHDLLGGGFFRYATDPGWQVPHFEKMLYDNAQLAALYLKGAGILGRPEYLGVGLETLDFILTGLGTGGAAYAASLSAVDDRDREGGTYLWRQEDLRALLSGDELDVVNLAWGLDGPPELESGRLPRRVADPERVALLLQRSADEVRRDLASAGRKLREARSARTVPRDDKVVAGWNGLVLSALAAAVRVSDGPVYRNAGDALYRYLTAVLWDGKRVARAGKGERVLEAGTLEDYALIARGLLDWGMVTGNQAPRDAAAVIAESAWRRFYTGSGWRLSEHPLLDYGVASPGLRDDVLPSPSATLIGTSLLLDARGGEGSLRDRARRALVQGGGLAQTDPFWFAGYVRLLAGADVEQLVQPDAGP